MLHATVWDMDTSDILRSFLSARDPDELLSHLGPAVGAVALTVERKTDEGVLMEAGWSSSGGNRRGTLRRLPLPQRSDLQLVLTLPPGNLSAERRALRDAASQQLVLLLASRELEEQVAAQEEELQTLLACCPAGMLRVGEDGAMLRASAGTTSPALFDAKKTRDTASALTQLGDTVGNWIQSGNYGATELRVGSGRRVHDCRLTRARAKKNGDDSGWVLWLEPISDLVAARSLSTERAETITGLHAELKGAELAIQALEHRRGLASVIGDSPQMARALAQARAAAEVGAATLITGPTGSGRRHLASAIHVGSKAGHLELNELRLDSLGETEAENAVRRATRGASVGSLLLLEVDRAAPKVQGRVARALGEVGRDCRLLATAGNSALLHKELQRVLGIVHIELPPLARRGADVIKLAEHYLSRLAEDGAPLHLSTEAKSFLLTHRWPGEVAQLRALLERAAAMAQGPVLGAEQLLPPARTTHPATGRAPLDRETVLEALRAEGGNRSAAARRLGVDRVTIWRAMKRWQLG